jgi:hypothetical protein
VARLIKLARGAKLQDAPAIHQRNAVRHRHRLDLVVRDIDEGGAQPLVQQGKLLAHMGAQLGVQIGQGFVHQEGGRVADQRPGEGHALALAAGQFGRAAVEERRNLQRGRSLFDGAAYAAPGLAVPGHEAAQQRQARVKRKAAHAQGRGDVLPDGHMRIERIGLEDHRKVAVAGMPIGDVVAADADGAAVRRFQSGDDPQKRGLAAPGHADQRQELTGAHVEVDALQDIVAAETFADAENLERTRCHFRAPFQKQRYPRRR